MADNTFLGLQPYTEDDAYRFKGRTEESQELFRLIARNDFTACYAESGEGKTSLLNAGVFPLLRENMYFPIAITFTSDDYKVTPDSFDAIIDRCIKDSIAEYNEKDKGVNIEYQLCSSDFHGLDSQAELQRELSKYSWWKLRNYKPQAMGLTFTPVFVFDQFEEVFNLPGSSVWTKKFFDWLEEVASDSCPDEIAKKVRGIIGDKAAFPTIMEEKGFKAVFSLRKEFMGELDYWGMQKCFIPGLRDNRYCLKALTYEGAKKVMTLQERFDEDKVEQVLTHFVGQYSREPERTIAENLPAVPALLLSVVCDSWEKDIAAFAKLSTDEIGQSLSKILEKFYDETIEAVIKDLTRQNKDAVTSDSIRRDIDTAMFDLVDVNGKRVRVKAVTTLGTISMESGRRFSEILPIVKFKEILNIHRIIKITKIDGEDYVEIVHDCLCPIIAKRREIRLAEETRKEEERKLHEQASKMRRRMKMVFAAFMIACCIVGLVSYQMHKLNEANHDISDANWKIMENRARFVGEKAAPLIDYHSDFYLACLIALDILPTNLSVPDKPYTPEAEGILRRACLLQNAKLVGHTDYVTSASFSPKGNKVVSASRDQTIRIWDVKTGKCDKILSGHESSVNSAEYSDDGKLIVSASSDSTLRIWNAVSGKLEKTIKGKYIYNVAVINHACTQIVSLSAYWENCYMSLWDIKTSTCLWSKKVNNNLFVSWNRDGSLLAVADGNNIQLCDAKTGSVVKSLRGHRGLVSHACFDETGKSIVSSAYDDKTIRVWDVKTGKCTQTIKAFENENILAGFCKGGLSIIAASNDSIRIWNRQDGSILNSTNSWESTCTSFSPDGKYGVGVPTYARKEIQLLSFEDRGKIIKLDHYNDVAVFRPNTTQILIANSVYAGGGKSHLPWLNTIKWIDYDSNRTFATHQVFSKSKTFFFGFSPKGNYIYDFDFNYSNNQGQLFLWNTQTGDSISIISGVNNYLIQSFSYDEKKLLSTSPQFDSISVWDIKTCKRLYKVNGGFALFNPKVPQVASVRTDSIWLWNSNNGDCTHVLAGNGKHISSVAYSPDGLLLASVDDECSIILWDSSTGERVSELAVTSPMPPHITFSPDGHRFIAYNNYLYSWDISNIRQEKVIHPECVRTFDEAFISNVSFNYDCTQLLADFSDNKIIFDIKTGIGLVTIVPNASNCYAGFMSDGKHFYHKIESSLSILPWPPLQELIDQTRERFKNRQLTPEERKKYYLE